MADTPTGGSGTDIASLGISVDATQPAQAAQTLDKLGEATIRVVKNIDDLAAASDKSAKNIGEASNQTRTRIALLQEALRVQQQVLDLEKEATAIIEAGLGTGAALIAQLREMVNTYGMTRTELLAYKAAQLDVMDQASVYISTLKELDQAVKIHGDRVKSLADIEKAEQSAAIALNAQRIRSINEAAAAEESARTTLNAQRIRSLEEQRRAEESAMTALNAQRVRMMTEQAQMEESARTSLNAQRIREQAANRKAAIEEIERMEAERLAGIEREKSREAVWTAFKRRTMEENRKAAIRELEEQQQAAIRLAEKQAVEEIRWNSLSVKSRIDELKRLQEYMSNSAIRPETINSSFSSAAIKDLPNLTRLQQEYNESLARSSHGHKRLKSDVEAGTDELHRFSFANKRAYTEMIVLAHEAVQGRWTRIPASMMVFAEYTNLAGVALTKTGAAITGAGLALAGMSYYVIKGILEQKDMSDALIMTGNYAGQTTESLLMMARTSADTAGSIGVAKEAAIALANSGRFTAESIGVVIDAVVAMEHATGKSVDATVKEFESLAVQTTGHTKRQQEQISLNLIKLNDRYHFTTMAVYEQIRALELEGRQREASALAMQTYSDELKRRADESIGNLGRIEKAWKAIKHATGEAIDAMMSWGKTVGPMERLAKAQAEQAAAQAELMRLQSGAHDRLSASREALAQERLAKANADVMATSRELLRVQENAYAQSERARVQADGMHAAQAVILKDTEILKKTLGEATWSIREYGEQLKAIAAADPNSPLLKQDIVDKHFAGLLKTHTAAAVRGADDRNQATDREINKLKELSALAQSAYKAQFEALDKYNKLGAVSDDVAYQARLETMTNEGNARIFYLSKQLTELKNFHGATAQERTRNKGQIEALEIEITKVIAEEINKRQAFEMAEEQRKRKVYEDLIADLNKLGADSVKDIERQIERQKQYNVEIGKTKEEKELLRQAAEEARTVQMEADAEFLRNILAAQDAEQQFTEKGIVAFQTRLKWLEEEIKKRQELAQLHSDGANAAALAQEMVEYNRQWSQLNKRIGDDLYSAITGGGDKATKKLIKDIKEAFARLVLNPFIQPISAGIASMFVPQAASAAGYLGMSGMAGEAAGGAGMVNGLGTLLSGASLATSAFGGTLATGFMNTIVGSGLSTGLGAGSAMLANGSIAQGLGMISGSLLPIAIALMAVAKGLEKKTVGSGLMGRVEGDDFSGNSYTFWKGGFLRGGSGTNLSAMSADTNKVFADAVNNMYGNFEALGDTIGVGSDILEDYSYEFRLALGDFAESDKPRIVQNLIARMTDSMAMAFVDSFRTSVDTAVQQASRYYTNTIDGERTFSGGVVTQERISSPLDPYIDDMIRIFDAQKVFLGDSEANLGKLAEFTTALFKLADGFAENTGYIHIFGEALDFDKLEATAQEGENVIETFTRLEMIFKSTAAVTLAVGQDLHAAFGQIGLASTEARQRVINLAGGIDQLVAGTSFFLNEFVSQAERLAPSMQDVSEALVDIGASEVDVTAANAREQLRDFAHGLDLTTQAGAEAYATLIRIAPQYAAIANHNKQIRDLEIDLLEAQGDTFEATNRRRAEELAALRLLDPALAAIKSQIYALEDAANARTVVDAYNAASRAVVQNLRNVGDVVQGMLQQLTAAEQATQEARNRISEEYFGAQDAVLDAQQRVNDLMRESAQQMTGFSTSIRDFLQSLKTGSLGSATLASSFAALKDQFAATAAMAKDGDKGAQQAITGIAEKLLQKAKEASPDRYSFIRVEAGVKAELNAIADAIDAMVGDINVPEVEDPLLQAQEDLLAAQERLVALQQLALQTGSSTDAAARQTANSVTALYEAYTQARTVETQARADYAAALVLTSNLALTSSNTLSGLMSALEQLSQAQGEFLQARDDLAQLVVDTTESAGSVNTFALALVAALGLTGDAADSLTAALADPATAAETLATMLGEGALDIGSESLSLANAIGLNGVAMELFTENIGDVQGVLPDVAIALGITTSTATALAQAMGEAGLGASALALMESLGLTQGSIIAASVAIGQEGLTGVANRVSNALGLTGDAAAALVQRFNSFQLQAPPPPPPPSTPQLSATEQFVTNVFQEVLGRNPLTNGEGLEFWSNAIETGALSMSDAATQIAMAAANPQPNYIPPGADQALLDSDDRQATLWLRAHGVPGFETGGDHLGDGMFSVAERGPELISRGQARIFNAGQTADILRNAARGDDMQDLAQAIDKLATILSRVDKNSEMTSTILKRVTNGKNYIATGAA